MGELVNATDFIDVVWNVTDIKGIDCNNWFMVSVLPSSYGCMR